MKAHHLQITVLIVLGALGLSWMAWQTKTLRKEVAALQMQRQELERKVEAANERVNHLAIKFANADSEVSVLRASVFNTRSMMTKEPQRFTWTTLHTVKRGFRDIQHHVAAGRFPGLALTDGYKELKQIFDNPAFEEMLNNDHGVLGR